MVIPDTDMPLDQLIDHFEGNPHDFSPDFATILQNPGLRYLSRLYEHLDALQVDWTEVLGALFFTPSQGLDIDAVQEAEAVVIEWMQARVAEESQAPLWLNHIEYQDSASFGTHVRPPYHLVRYAADRFNYFKGTRQAYFEALHLVRVLTGLDLSRVHQQPPTEDSNAGPGSDVAEDESQVDVASPGGPYNSVASDFDPEDDENGVTLPQLGFNPTLLQHYPTLYHHGPPRPLTPDNPTSIPPYLDDSEVQSDSDSSWPSPIQPGPASSASNLQEAPSTDSEQASEQTIGAGSELDSSVTGASIEGAQASVGIGVPDNTVYFGYEDIPGGHYLMTELEGGAVEFIPLDVGTPLEAGFGEPLGTAYTF
ncbi:MAG: hypothetical protein M1837_005930 [Sclerophora amabilis]|nr:MAG: hypothetical protein M1837_005930 [Sclerophora amabilis]